MAPTVSAAGNTARPVAGDGRAHVLFDDTVTSARLAVVAGSPATPRTLGVAPHAAVVRPHAAGAGGSGVEVLGFAQSGEITSGAWQADLHLDLLSTIAYFGVNMNGDGSLVTTDSGYQGWWSQQTTDLINTAHHSGDRVVLVVKAFDSATISSITQNEPYRQNAIRSIANELNQRGGDGVNIDFEGLQPSIAGPFTTFIAELQAGLRSAAPLASYLTVDTYASAARGGTMYDIGSLRPYVDAFDVMAYDFYYGGSSHSGPVAPLNGSWYNDSAAVADFLRLVPGSQVILGVPYYGYKWSTASNQPQAAALAYGTADTYSGALDDFSCAQQLSLNWDNTFASPWATWWSPGSGDPCGGNHNAWRELYYENATSLGAKYDLVNDNGLRGIGIWSLGYDTGHQELWNEIAAKFTVAHSGKAFVRQLFADLLGRAVDPASLNAFADAIWHGADHTSVAYTVTRSSEFDSDTVTGYYRSLLRRNPDAQGLQQWVAYVRAGGVLEALQAEMMGSAEYLANRAGGTNDGFVTALYSDVLGRAPDSVGRSEWLQALASGVRRTDVAWAVLTSTEDLSNRVGTYYVELLRRGPDPSGRSAWVGAIQAGVRDEYVMAAICGSPEYIGYAETHQPND